MRRTATAAARRSTRPATRGGRVPVPEGRELPARPGRCSPADRAAKKPAWLNDVRRYHNRGDIDFGSCSEVCFEQGDFFGLDDLFTEQPTVVDGLAQVYARLDPPLQARRLPRSTPRATSTARSSSVWVPKIRAAARAAGVRDFELFGEVFVTDAIELSSFVRDRGLPNVLDFPFQDARDPVRRPATRARRGSSRGSTTTTTSWGRAALRTRRRPSSATTTWAAPRG